MNPRVLQSLDRTDTLKTGSGGGAATNSDDLQFLAVLVGIARGINPGRLNDVRAPRIGRSVVFSGVHHKVSAALLQGLQGSADVHGAMVDADVFNHLKREASHSAVLRMLTLAQWPRIVDALEARGVSVLTVKGPASSLQLYGDATIREYNDLDLLVDTDDLVSVCPVMELLGFQLDEKNRIMATVPERYRSLAVMPGHATFYRADSPVRVELHSHLWKMGNRDFSLNRRDLFDRSVGIEWNGNTFRTLHPVDHGLYQFYHGTSHAWSILHWLVDAAAFLTAATEEEIIRFTRGAASLGIQRGVAVAVRLLRRLYPTLAVHPAVAEMAENFRDETAPAVDYAWRILHTGIGDFNRITHVWQKTVSFDRYVMRGVSRYNALVQPFRVTDSDIRDLPLPGWLYPLYPLLRPFLVLRRALARTLLLLCLVLVAACSLPFEASPADEVTDREPDGRMIIRHGDFLYSIGDTVQYASVESIDRFPTEWHNTAPLPEPRTDAVVVSLGHYMYVLGGRDEGGSPQDTIYYAYIRSDGPLGFSDPGSWLVADRPLPVPVAGAAWVFHDGALYLFGGETATGISDGIMFARVYYQGTVGDWYHLDTTLDGPTEGAAATVLRDETTSTIIVAGGVNGTEPSRRVSRYTIQPDSGLVHRDHSLIPEPTIRPILTTLDAETVLLLGTDGSIHRGRSDATGITWTVNTRTGPETTGPSHGRAAGAIFGNAYRIDLDLPPEAPVVQPGSGTVPEGTWVRAYAEPGTVIRYRLSAIDAPIPEVTAGDPAWPTEHRLVDSTVIAFRAFDRDGNASPVIVRRYEVRSSDLFVETQPFEVNQSLPADPPLSDPGWHRVVPPRSGSYILWWGSTEAITAAPVLYERNRFTPVYVHRNTESTRTMELGGNEYYLYLPDTMSVAIYPE